MLVHKIQMSLATDRPDLSDREVDDLIVRIVKAGIAALGGAPSLGFHQQFDWGVCVTGREEIESNTTYTLITEGMASHAGLRE